MRRSIRPKCAKRLPSEGAAWRSSRRSHRLASRGIGPGCCRNSVVAIPRWVISRSSQIDQQRRPTEDDKRRGPEDHRTGLDTIPAGRPDSHPLLRLARRPTSWTISFCRYHTSLGTLYGQLMVEFLFCER
jgi:hypothetical protein